MRSTSGISALPAGVYFNSDQIDPTAVTLDALGIATYGLGSLLKALKAGTEAREAVQVVGTIGSAAGVGNASAALVVNKGDAGAVLLAVASMLPGPWGALASASSLLRDVSPGITISNGR